MTIRFAIPSFITTLGMLFMARSLTVVDLRRLPAAAARRPAELDLHRRIVGPGELFRMSFIWFVGDRRCSPPLMLSRTNFGNWIKRHRRLPRGGRLDGHPDQRA